MKHNKTNKDNIDPVKMLDALLIHVQIGGWRLSAAEFDDLDEKDDNQEEEPPKLPEALDMVRKLHFLTSSQHPNLHQRVRGETNRYSSGLSNS
jgi:hypothetical protein